MTVATPSTLDADPSPRPAVAATASPPVPSHRREQLLLIAGWVFLAIASCGYAWQIVRIGVDVREGFWVYWRPNRFVGDIAHAYQQGNFALERGKILVSQQGRPWIDQPGPGLNHFFAISRQIIDGWVNTYDHLQQTVPSGEYDLDYPPLRLLAMTVWVWDVQSKYPGLTSYPNTPVNITDPRTHHRLRATADVAAPLLRANMWADGISALAMLALVWIWVHRAQTGAPILGTSDWRDRFGDPMLLSPLVLMGIFWMLYPHFTWQLEPPRATRAGVFDLDEHVTSVAFWLWWIVRFLCVVCLARLLPPPYRAPACGLVAATLVWLNPAMILDGVGWPQWDGWILPFFLIAAVLASVDWWLCAGVMLGVGCMFKGQILFMAPVLLLCPLLAGWPGRFMRIVAGMAAAGGVILWPWLVSDHTASLAIIVTVVAAAVICVLAILRREIFALPVLVYRPIFAGSSPGRSWFIRRLPAPQFKAILPALRQEPRLRWHIIWFTTAMIVVAVAAVLILVRFAGTEGWFKVWLLLMCAAVIIVPWLVPRRMWAGWLVLVFASAAWLGAFVHEGRFSWFDVGFAYGTRKFDEMQVSPNSLSNLAGILESRFGWQLHDRVTTVQFPWYGDPTDVDLRQFLAAIYFATLLLCTIGAAIHMRRRSTHFLIALAAPSILFVTLLTQMSVRYTILAAALSAGMVGVSAGMSVFQMLLTVLSCVMLGTRLMHAGGDNSITLSIFDKTHPDLGYAMLLIGAVFLYGAIAPDRRAGRRGDL